MGKKEFWNFANIGSLGSILGLIVTLLLCFFSDDLSLIIVTIFIILLGICIISTITAALFYSNNKSLKRTNQEKNKTIDRLNDEIEKLPNKKISHALNTRIKTEKYLHVAISHYWEFFSSLQDLYRKYYKELTSGEISQEDASTIYEKAQTYIINAFSGILESLTENINELLKLKEVYSEESSVGASIKQPS